MKSQYMRKLYEELNNTSDEIRLELIANAINKKLNSVLGIVADIDVAIDQNDVIVDAVNDINSLHLVLGFSHDQYGDLLIISPYDVDLNNVADDMAGVVDISKYNPPKLLHKGAEVIDATTLDWLPDEAFVSALPRDVTNKSSNEAVKLIQNRQKLMFPIESPNWTTSEWDKPIKVGYRRVNDTSGHTVYQKMDNNSLGALRNLPIISYRAIH